MPPRVKCPNCRKEAEWDDNPHRPFCSERCRLIDLGAWLEEKFRIPGSENEPVSPDQDSDGDEIC